MITHYLTTPLTEENIKNLKAGDKIILSGKIFVARDQAHARMITQISEGKKLPFDPDGQIIYYSGPSPAKKGDFIGASGPTTSARMDSLTEPLLKAGIKGTIGKGERSDAVKNMTIKFKAPYFAAMGGGGALYHSCIKSSKIIAYEDLGTEALRCFIVKNMPLFVAYDIYSGSVFR